jgi:hypothetical protein
LDQPCKSDDGKPYPGDGACQGSGVYVCNGLTATKCSAVKNTGAVSAELCDGIDNDCDGSVDETYQAKGTNATYFVKPAVVSIGTNLWTYAYEASRPGATTNTPGTGDGYWCAPGTSCPVATPSGVTADKTAACSVSGKIPWFNVTPAEVEQTCTAMGGFVCTSANWKTACHTGSSCTWGYGSNCTTRATYTSGNFCNLGPFNFNGVANADGLLPTASDNPPSAAGPLVGCYANTGTGIFDITGNLREITKQVIGTVTSYPLMGGAFNTQSDDGATCDFDFYAVSSSFKFFDTGFRCCFSADPTQ